LRAAQADVALHNKQHGIAGHFGAYCLNAAHAAFFGSKLDVPPGYSAFENRKAQEIIFSKHSTQLTRLGLEIGFSDIEDFSSQRADNDARATDEELKHSAEGSDAHLLLLSPALFRSTLDDLLPAISSDSSIVYLVQDLALACHGHLTSTHLIGSNPELRCELEEHGYWILAAFAKAGVAPPILRQLAERMSAS
jgi:hypothetical protein